MSYTPEEIKKELENFRLPWIAKIWKKYGVKALSYSVLPIFLTVLVFGIIYNESTRIYDWIWVLLKAIAFVFIFGFGLFALTGHFVEKHAVNKLRKKLGLSHMEFQKYVVEYQII